MIPTILNVASHRETISILMAVARFLIQDYFGKSRKIVSMGQAVLLE